jgi:tyrosine-protein kinase Etk/Wzc
VDEGAIRQLLAQVDNGQVTSRDLAAYPVFSRGSAVSPLAAQLSELEIQRARLLERRTERDPEVRAIDSSIAVVSASIIAMARSYASSVAKQRAEFQKQIQASEQNLRAMPAANERVGRLQRDVLRLTQLYTALQAQLVEARLAAIGEGGDVRVIDAATVPKKAAFPRPLLTLGAGTAGGLMMGLIAALFLGWFGRWMRDPADVERLTGISAHRVRPDVPLLVAGAGGQRTLLVVPLERRAQSRVVAESLARTASARALPVNVLDLSNGNGQGIHASSADIARITDLEQQQGVVVVQLPELSSDTTVAALRENRPVVLVAPPGPVDRVRLTSALETLRRLGVPCAGIVMSDAEPRLRLGSAS